MNMYASLVCVREGLPDLSVGPQRAVRVGYNHTGIMGDEVKGQGQEYSTVRIGGLIKWSRLCTHHQACDGRCSRGI